MNRKPTTLWGMFYPVIAGVAFGYHYYVPVFSIHSTVYDAFEAGEYWIPVSNYQEWAGYRAEFYPYYQLPALFPDIDVNTPPPAETISIPWQREDEQAVYGTKFIARYVEEPLQQGSLVTDPDYWENLLLRHYPTGAERYTPQMGWYAYQGSYADTKYLAWNTISLAPGIMSILAPLLLLGTSLCLGSGAVSRPPRKRPDS